MLPERVRASKAIRKELKETFEGTKFSVRSSSFAGGDSISVEWIDGPTYDVVMRMIGKYQYGKYKSCCDIYEITNEREDIPQTKYILANREISNDIEVDALEICKEKYACFEGVDWFTDQTKNGESVRRFLDRYLKQMDLRNGLNPDMFNLIDGNQSTCEEPK